LSQQLRVNVAKCILKSENSYTKCPFAPTFTNCAAAVCPEMGWDCWTPVFLLINEPKLLKALVFKLAG
jgi:hypothetical protein